ncbi:MAG: fibronectin type III domain-containing protein [Longimicrobiales bacterium]
MNTMRLSRSLLRAALLVVAMTAAACSDDDPTAPQVQAPAAPTAVSATAKSATEATVTFGAVSGATGYVVERAPGSGGSFAQVGTPTASPFEDKALTASTAYRYRVAAVNSTGTGSFSDAVIVTTAAAGPKTAVISADITSNRTLFADTLYTLRGFIKVANGATLTIQPGTVIHGDYDVVGSSLFVLRGAKIEANGTAEKPIVFTSSRPQGQRQAGDWGGIIIIGNGIVNRTGDIQLEGTGTGASNPAILYSGGNNNADNSGTLRYVRVEFAGYATAADAELNTFTFGAVGSGTTLEYLQALSGLDDSFEFFGGAVDGKYLVSYDAGDDHFDMSEGYVGRLQHVIALQTRQVVPRAGAGNVSSDPQGIENDGCAGSGCTNGQDSQPFNVPMVANFTLVGPADGIFSGTAGGIGMMLRRGTGGHYVNGVVARWERAGISLRDQPTLNRGTAGQLTVKNVHVADVGATFQPQSGSTVQGSLDLAGNAIVEGAGTGASLFVSVPMNPTNVSQLDWAPAASSAIATGGMAAFAGDLATKAGTFVTATAYRGAANPNGPKWWATWTSYAIN